ncbi:hypothetical protein MCAP1_002015 [Malassezia caprae]|uniref:Uncharacterized protein n=1 Tax=Malassezia caprae TaxID=1381934 RepID=A0AAF0IVG0_9BASI|nr:hypothetical protein MCAP1_002015 [Malassezia caprae]
MTSGTDSQLSQAPVADNGTSENSNNNSAENDVENDANSLISDDESDAFSDNADSVDAEDDPLLESTLRNTMYNAHALTGTTNFAEMTNYEDEDLLDPAADEFQTAPNIVQGGPLLCIKAVYLNETDAHDGSEGSQYAINWAMGTVLRDGDETLIVSVMETDSKLDTPYDDPAKVASNRKIRGDMALPQLPRGKADVVNNVRMRHMRLDQAVVEKYSSKHDEEKDDDGEDQKPETLEQKQERQNREIERMNRLNRKSLERRGDGGRSTHVVDTPQHLYDKDSQELPTAEIEQLHVRDNVSGPVQGS